MFKNAFFNTAYACIPSTADFHCSNISVNRWNKTAYSLSDSSNWCVIVAMSTQSQDEKLDFTSLFYSPQLDVIDEVHINDNWPLVEEWQEAWHVW